MTFQYSTTVRNAKLDAVESSIGVSALLRVFSGAEPANCAAADPAGLLCTINLPVDWMAAASAGTKVLSGSWTGNASGAGNAASWRIYDTTGTTCHIQGNTTDMTFSNVNIAVGQTVTVTSFQLTAGNS
jgi:hypothetical protein